MDPTLCDQAPVESHSSAVSVGSPSLSPPATRTRPSFSNVAVWLSRAVRLEPTA